MTGSGRQAGIAKVRGPLPKVMLATAFAVTAALGAIMTGPISAEGGTTGSVSSFGSHLAYGSPAGDQLNARLTGMASTPDGKGYWLVAADGGIFNYGDAGFFGSDGGSVTFFPYVGIGATPSGHGYWVTNTFGTTEHFGDAADEGSLGTLGISPAAPMVGITATPGAGYWLEAADGGVFSFGDAAFEGSMGGKALNAPAVGMARTPDGNGYWLVAADGGVFSFGDAAFYGSMGGKALNAPIVGMAASADGNGYWLVAADGGVFSFGNAVFLGSLGANPPAATTPVVGLAADSSGGGYWLTTTDKALPAATPAPSVLNECNVPTAGPAVKPATIVLACGDANASLSDLNWTSWTSSSATATGQYVRNTCVPNCAQGTFVTSVALIRLAYPIQTGVGPQFASVSYVYANASAPGGSSGLATVIPTSPG